MIKVTSSIRGCRDWGEKKAIFNFLGWLAGRCVLCQVQLPHLVRFPSKIEHFVLVFMAGEADNGKTVRNIVKLPVSGCKISVRNKFLVQLPVLSASLV